MLENKVVEMLDQLSQKLGVASAKIWEWSMLQVKVDLITDIIVLLLAIGLTFLFTKCAIKSYKKWDDFSYDTQAWITVSLIVLGVLLFCCDIYAMVSMLEIPKLLINPEFAAFQKIMSQLGNLK